MSEFKIKGRKYEHGLNMITNFADKDWDDPHNIKMNFGVLILNPNEQINVGSFSEFKGFEKAALLMGGKIKFTLKGINGKNENLNQGSENEIIFERKSIFFDNPSCVLADKDTDIIITNIGQNAAELALIGTKNEKNYDARVFKPEDCRSEERGKGTMRETSTRIVRTIFDDNNANFSNLVLGEDINYPGKWSSYPPHTHPQPEFYHYRFLPENGFGFSMLGEDAEQVHHGDTILIFNTEHSQTSAPGYAMYYIWAIRHLEGNRYGPSTNTPIFDPQHLWVTDPKNDSKIFPPKN
ncbi:MAG: 5-deoxy-glucuronate isomerase [Promethearchaeota archaeon]